MSKVTNNNAPVVVTDVRYRMSLSIIRALGRKGIKVIAAENKSTSKSAALGFYSKYSNEKILLSDADKSESSFIKDLIAYAANSYQKAVLIPVGIHSIMAVASNKDKLKSYYDFIIPNIECINIANDTNKLLDIAREIGIPVPDTTTLQTDETIEELSLRIKYPVVIKYRQGELLKLGPEKRYKIVHNSTDFVSIFSVMHKLQEYPLVQEYISGDGFGVSAVFDKAGEPIEVFCHKRLREYPVSGGPSCFCESFWDEKMVNYAVKLLKTLKWQGVAMVEFKGDPEGRLALMEINPRIWGSFPLTLAAGLDFPYTIYKAAIYHTRDKSYSASMPNYKTNKKMRYILQDLMSFKGYLNISKNKTAFILKFLKDMLNPTISDGVFDIKDIKSSLQYFKQAIRKFNR